MLVGGSYWPDLDVDLIETRAKRGSIKLGVWDHVFDLTTRFVVSTRLVHISMQFWEILEKMPKTLKYNVDRDSGGVQLSLMVFRSYLAVKEIGIAKIGPDRIMVPSPRLMMSWGRLGGDVMGP